MFYIDLDLFKLIESKWPLWPTSSWRNSNVPLLDYQNLQEFQKNEVYPARILFSVRMNNVGHILWLWIVKIKMSRLVVVVKLKVLFIRMSFEMILRTPMIPWNCVNWLQSLECVNRIRKALVFLTIAQFLESSSIEGSVKVRKVPRRFIWIALKSRGLCAFGFL